MAHRIWPTNRGFLIWRHASVLCITYSNCALLLCLDIRSVPLASDPSAGSLIDCVRFLVHLCTRLSPSSLTHSLHPCRHRRRHRSGHHPSLFIIHYTSHRHCHPTSPSSTSCGRRYIPVTALDFACSAHQQPSNKDRFAHLSRKRYSTFCFRVKPFTISILIRICFLKASRDQVTTVATRTSQETRYFSTVTDLSITFYVTPGKITSSS